MTIQEIKRKYKLTNKDIAYFFGYKNAASYSNSSNKERIETGIQFIIDRVETTLKNIEPCKK